MRDLPSPRPKQVFLDSSGLLALVSQTDAYHQAAGRGWAALILREGWSTYTSNLIVAEAHALFLTRLGYGPATTLLRSMEHSSATILRVTPEIEERARRKIYRYMDKRFSFTDATSFALMERHRIGVALTSDHYFVQYGFQALGI